MHLYLHTPYCAAKCPYCDFNSLAERHDEHAAYVAALLTEVRRLPRGPYATVFLGGGTPTYLGARLLGELLAGVRAHIALTDDYEWTCEANPGSSDGERFAVLAEHGVNRISLGVQSTHDHHLAALGRVHRAGEAEHAIALARHAVPRVSADLIYGLPGQTVAELRSDLELYRRHDLQHASVYHLAFEPGTEYHARLQRGEMREITADTSHALADVLWDGLHALGLNAYETSNFARPGQESRHNLAYWLGRDYQAAGAGAVSTIAGVRMTRDKNPARYIAAITSGGTAAWKVETLTARDRLRECWMLGLRLRRGVSIERLRGLGDDDARWRPIAASLCDLDLLHEHDGHLSVTARGRLLQDDLTIRLMP